MAGPGREGPVSQPGSPWHRDAVGGRVCRCWGDTAGDIEFGAYTENDFFVVVKKVIVAESAKAFKVILPELVFLHSRCRLLRGGKSTCRWIGFLHQLRNDISLLNCH